MTTHDSAAPGSNDPGEADDTEQAINPATSPAILASLADDRPALRPLIAGNPSAPVHTLMWLRDLRDEAIDRALANNPTAKAAHVVRRVMVLPPPRANSMPTAPTSSSLAPPLTDRDPTPATGIASQAPEVGTAWTSTGDGVTVTGTNVASAGGAGSPIDLGPETDRWRRARPETANATRGAGAASAAGAAAGAAAGLGGALAKNMDLGAASTRADGRGFPAPSGSPVPGPSEAPQRDERVNAMASSHAAVSPDHAMPPLPTHEERELSPARGAFATWAFLLVPLLFIAGCIASYQLFRGGSSKKSQSAAPSIARTAPFGSATTVVTGTTPPTVALAPTEAPTTAAPAPAPAPETAAPTPAPETAAAAANSAGAADNADPAGGDAAAPTPTAAPARRTTVPARRVTPTTARVTPVPTAAAGQANTDANATKAVNLAQQLATALANSDWSTARTLSPSSAQTDANYNRDYGNLTDSTVVPVTTTRKADGTYALRIGLVAHETTSAGVRQTVLFCSHWDVDPANSTIRRVSGTKVRTIAGRTEAAAVSADLKTTCSGVTLA